MFCYNFKICILGKEKVSSGPLAGCNLVDCRLLESLSEDFRPSFKNCYCSISRKLLGSSYNKFPRRMDIYDYLQHL